MTPTRPIKAIIFDMDGTLLDTEVLSDKAVLLAFGDSLPKTVLDEEPMSQYRIPWDLKKKMLGLRGTEWAPIAINYGKEHWEVNDENPPPNIDEFITAWERHLNEMCEEIEACRGAVDLVESVAKMKLPMAIATSSRMAGVTKKRKRHDNIFQHMQTIVTGDDPAVKNGKPAPDIYLEAAKRLGVNPENCLVFEDALSGVRSGKAAGCRVVAIPDPRFSVSELVVFHEEADVVVKDLTEFDSVQFA